MIEEITQKDREIFKGVKQMTENKRYFPHKQMSGILGYECVFDTEKEKWLSIRDTILRLNVLNDEIIAQGIVIEGYQNRNQQLFDENEELKDENQRWEDVAVEDKEHIESLQEKNEQLKTELDELKSHIVEEEEFYPASYPCYLCPECEKELVKEDGRIFCKKCGRIFTIDEIPMEYRWWKTVMNEITRERPTITVRKWVE